MVTELKSMAPSESESFETMSIRVGPPSFTPVAVSSFATGAAFCTAWLGAPLPNKVRVV